VPGWSLLLIAAALGDAPDAGTGLETVIRADRGPDSTPSVELRGRELEEVPGTMGDPVRAVLMLPGVSTIASGVSYPIVRGSGPATTAYLIDGVQVPMLFHLFVGPSVIHPDLIRSVELHPGAPGPEYGRLLGGAVEAATAQPAGDHARATAYLDLDPEASY